jgi:hypothetical protein
VILESGCSPTSYACGGAGIEEDRGGRDEDVCGGGKAGLMPEMPLYGWRLEADGARRLSHPVAAGGEPGREERTLIQGLV